MQNSFSCLMYEGFLVCTASFKSANQHLNRIKIFDLVISIFFFFFAPFLTGLMFWLIVMLQGPQLHRESHIFLHIYLLELSRIHSGFCDGELARPCCSKETPNHSRYEVLVLKCCLWSKPNMSAVTVPK